VLAQDGIFRFFNISTCHQLIDLGEADNRIARTVINAMGSYVTCLMASGNINIYSVQALSRSLHQAPPALVKMIAASDDGEDVERSKVKGTVTARLNASQTTEKSAKHTAASQMKVCIEFYMNVIITFCSSVLSEVCVPI
jgi:hypothetical protein